MTATRMPLGVFDAAARLKVRNAFAPPTGWLPPAPIQDGSHQDRHMFMKINNIYKLFQNGTTPRPLRASIAGQTFM